MTRESKFQFDLTRELEKIFPGCIILKNDPNYLQGFPDWTIFWKEHWGVLEVKASENSPVRPNQKYWIERCDKMSFGRFIYPENMVEILNELQLSWGSSRSTRLFKWK